MTQHNDSEDYSEDCTGRVSRLFRMSQQIIQNESADFSEDLHPILTTLSDGAKEFPLKRNGSLSTIDFKVCKNRL